MKHLGFEGRRGPVRYRRFEIPASERVRGRVAVLRRSTPARCPCRRPRTPPVRIPPRQPHLLPVSCRRRTRRDRGYPDTFCGWPGNPCNRWKLGQYLRRRRSRLSGRSWPSSPRLSTRVRVWGRPPRTSARLSRKGLRRIPKNVGCCDVPPS